MSEVSAQAPSTPDTDQPPSSAEPAQEPSSPASPAAEAPKGYVPSQALQQERARRRAVEAQAQQTQNQLAQMEQRINEIQAPKAPQVDPYRAQLIARLGTDQAGVEALEMFDAHEAYVASKLRSEMPSEERLQAVVEQRAGQMIDQKLGQYSDQQQAQMFAATQLQGWVNAGLVNPEQAVEIRQEYEQIAADAPHVRTRVNTEAVLNNLYMQRLSGGKIDLRNPPPKPPVGPSAPSMGPAVSADPPEVTDPTKHPMQALRGVKPEVLKRIREQSIARHAAAQGS